MAANITLMGWNQVVRVSTDGGSTYKPYKASDYSVGITQNFDVPQFVSGRSDRMTWSKGIIEVGGSLNVPMVRSTAGLWLTAAEEACVPVDTGGVVNTSAILHIRSSVHPPISNCMVQTFQITAQEGQQIQLTMELFGTLLDENSETPLDSVLDTTDLNYSSDANKGASAQDAVVALGANLTNDDSAWGGDPIGADISAYGGDSESTTDDTTMVVEEIPMFDAVYGVKQNLPIDNNGNSVGEPISFTFTINNNLIRNYVLGSLRGLDAFSIASGQRELTGEVSWQSLGNAESSYNGTIGQIINTGTTTTTQDIFIGGTFSGSVPASAPTDAIFRINMSQAMLLWGARPPVLNTGKVTASANFQLIAKDGAGTGPSGTTAKGFLSLQP